MLEQLAQFALHCTPDYLKQHRYIAILVGAILQTAIAFVMTSLMLTDLEQVNCKTHRFVATF